MLTHIQSKSLSSSNGTASGFFPANTTSGNSLIAVVTRQNPYSVADGNVTAGEDVLEFQGSIREGGLTIETWTKNGIIGGDQHIDVVTSGNGRVNVEFQEWSGVTE